MKKYKYPKTVRIGALDYTLEFVPEGLQDRIDGQQWDSKQTLKVHAGMLPQYTSVIIIHEILHGVYWDRGLDKDSTEEQVVDMMAKGLADLLRDNPGLFPALVEDLK